MHDQLFQRIEYLEARLAIQDLRHRYWLAIVAWFVTGYAKGFVSPF